MLVQLERPSDRPNFAEQVARDLMARHPQLAGRVRTVADLEGAAPVERERYHRGTPVDPDGDDPAAILQQMAAHGTRVDGIDVALAFSDVCRVTVRPGETLVALGSPPSFVYVPTGRGLIVRPGGGYTSEAAMPWVPIGTTGVIRRAERNSEVFADEAVDVIMIPGELYARAWFRPYSPDQSRSRPVSRASACRRAAARAVRQRRPSAVDHGCRASRLCRPRHRHGAPVRPCGPMAIGFSGLVILVLEATSSEVGALVVITFVVCAVWTWNATRLYRSYATSLVAAVRHRPLIDDEAGLALDASEAIAARRLLASERGRDVRLGLDLLGSMSSPATRTELAKLADDPRLDVRLAALERLAASGEQAATEQLREEVAAGASSCDPDERAAAARALGGLADRSGLVRLLRDPDPDVRVEAVRAVRTGDDQVVDAVIEALADPRTSGAAARALERLGDAVVPAVAAALSEAGCPAPPATMRLVRALRAAAPNPAVDVLRPYIGHPDRELGLTVLSVLAEPEPAAAPLISELTNVLHADAQDAARVLAAMTTCAGVFGEVAWIPLHRALEDEYELLRARITAGLTTRHGRHRLGPAIMALDGDATRRGWPSRCSR
jgi:HEAT repeat protein